MANPINNNTHMTFMALIPHHNTPFKAVGAVSIRSSMSNVLPQVKYKAKIAISMRTEPNNV